MRLHTALPVDSTPVQMHNLSISDCCDCVKCTSSMLLANARYTHTNKLYDFWLEPILKCIDCVTRIPLMAAVITWVATVQHRAGVEKQQKKNNHKELCIEYKSKSGATFGSTLQWICTFSSSVCAAFRIYLTFWCPSIIALIMFELLLLILKWNYLGRGQLFFSFSTENTDGAKSNVRTAGCYVMRPPLGISQTRRRSYYILHFSIAHLSGWLYFGRAKLQTHWDSRRSFYYCR